MKITYLFLIASSLVLFSCNTGEDTVVEDPDVSITEISQEDEKQLAITEEFEAYMDMIDADDSMDVGRSLYYTNQAGASIEVVFKVNAEGDIVKLEEYTVQPGSGTVYSNLYYLKDGKRYATKQFFEEGEGEQAFFTELRSYYDEKENVVATKQRSAEFEESLDYEMFAIGKKQECTIDRPMKVINAEGPFETTFQGFIEVEEYLYLLVGENTPDGYVSSLIVQFRDGTIQKLRENELGMKGTPLQIEFATTSDASGEQQILLGVQIKE